MGYNKPHVLLGHGDYVTKWVVLTMHTTATLAIKTLCCRWCWHWSL